MTLIPFDPAQVPVADILHLLELAVGPPNRERALAVLESREAARLYVALAEGRPAGIIRFCRTGPTSGEITHLAVTPEYQRQGIGRAMVHELAHLEALREVWAETDQAAVGFYHSLGFDIASLGEKYPGVERFRCTLHCAG